MTDTFSYQMADGAAATAIANLVVTITGTNDAPVAVADAAAVTEDVTLAAAGNVLANDTDVDAGDTQTVDPGNGAARQRGRGGGRHLRHAHPQRERRLHLHAEQRRGDVQGCAPASR